MLLLSYTSRIRHAEDRLLPYWEEHSTRLHSHYTRGLLTKREYHLALAELHADYRHGVASLARAWHPVRTVPKAMALTLSGHVRWLFGGRA